MRQRGPSTRQRSERPFARFETIVERIVREIAATCTGVTCDISRNVPIQSARNDRVTHNVDIVWTFSIGPVTYHTFISTKFWKKRVKIDHVREMRDILADSVSRPTGIIVTTHGFQSGALEHARSYGIYLWNVQDVHGDLRLPQRRFRTKYDIDVRLIAIEYNDDSGVNTIVDFTNQGVIRDSDVYVNQQGQMLPLKDFFLDTLAFAYMPIAEVGDLLDELGEWTPREFEADVDIYLHGTQHRLESMISLVRLRTHREAVAKPRLSSLFAYVMDDLTRGETFGVGPGTGLINISEELFECDICAFPLPSDRLNLFRGNDYCLTSREGITYEMGDWQLCHGCFEFYKLQDYRGLSNRSKLMATILQHDRSEALTEGRIEALLAPEKNWPTLPIEH